MARRSLHDYQKYNYDTNNMANDTEIPIEDDTDGQYIEENLNLEEKLNDSFDQSILSSFLDNISSLFNSFQWKHFTIFIIGIVVAIIFGWMFIIGGKSDLQREHEDTILKLLMPMSKKFITQQKNTWYQILTGLTNLVKQPVSPAVYLLLSDDKSKMTSSCIVEMITSIANKLLLKNQKWILLNGTELSRAKSTDPGIIVESVADKMQHSKVVVISDIQKIPGNLAAGFHFLVDQENPKIREAVYVFTMTYEKTPIIIKPLDVAEKILQDNWKDLSGNVLYPLITRVTEAVLHITQEKEIGICPLKTSSMLEIKIP